MLTCLLTFAPYLTQALSLHLWAKGSGTEQQVRTSAGAGEEEEGAEWPGRWGTEQDSSGGRAAQTSAETTRGNTPRAGRLIDLYHFHDENVHNNNGKCVTFIFDAVIFESVFLCLENTTPTANRTTEKQMVDAYFWPTPLTHSLTHSLTQNDIDQLCV